MPNRRFPMDYPFGPRHIAMNGVAATVLLFCIGIILGTLIIWVLS